MRPFERPELEAREPPDADRNLDEVNAKDNDQTRQGHFFEQAVIFCESLEKAATTNLSRDKTSHQGSITKILYDKNIRSLEDS